jgi:hypothetical protein
MSARAATAFTTNAVPVLLIAATRIAKGAKPVLPVLLTAAPARRLKKPTENPALYLQNVAAVTVSTANVAPRQHTAATITATAEKPVLPALLTAAPVKQLRKRTEFPVIQLQNAKEVIVFMVSVVL